MDYEDWFTKYLDEMIVRMQMQPGTSNDNMIFIVNQLRLAYKQGKIEGK